MIQLTPEFKNLVAEKILTQRERFAGTDSAFAKSLGINPSVYSRLKKGERDGILSETQYLNIGQQLDVSLHEQTWNIVSTDVLQHIEQDVRYCQANARSMIFCDETDIGKTTSGKYLARTLDNCLYISGCQCKSVREFVMALAKAVGADSSGTLAKVKSRIKYMLRSVLRNAVIIIDEAGDLEYQAFLVIKEFWNATEGFCGWYLARIIELSKLAEDDPDPELKDGVSIILKAQRVGKTRLILDVEEKLGPRKWRKIEGDFSEIDMFLEDKLESKPEGY